MVTARNKKEILRICTTHKIRILAIFGSAVRGKSRDIDFAVYEKPGAEAGSVNKLELISELESLFGKKADIVLVNPGTSTTLLYEICRNSVLLYEADKGSFEEERSIAFRKYANAFKFRKLREDTIRNFVEG